MGKITNIILNSTNKTSGTLNNDLTYYIDWSAILKNNTKYKLTFNYQGSYNYVNSFRFPYLTSNIITTNVTLNGSTNYNLGNLKLMTTANNQGYFMSSVNDNVPLYLENRPQDNNLNIRCYDNINNTLFTDESYSTSGQGTCTQSNSNLLTISSINSGAVIYIGTVIQIAGYPDRTIIAFTSGTGGVGSYQVDVFTPGGIPAGTNYNFVSNPLGSPNAPYVLNLSFEETD